MSQPLVRPAPPTDDNPAAALPLAGQPRPWPLLLLKTMRPKQWAKNVFVFAALIFAFKLTDLRLVGLTVAAFAVFCLVSSAVYIMNDLGDRKQDAQHPRKKYRPLAS